MWAIFEMSIFGGISPKRLIPALQIFFVIFHLEVTHHLDRILQVATSLQNITYFNFYNKTHGEETSSGNPSRNLSVDLS